MPAAARSKLCSSVSAWLGVFARMKPFNCIQISKVGDCRRG